MNFKCLVVLCLLSVSLHIVNSAGARENRRQPAARQQARPDNIAAASTDSRIKEETTSDLADPAQAKHMNPVSRLNLIAMTQNRTLPSYELIEQKIVKNSVGHIVNKQFHISAKMNDYTAEGWGLTKKEAKRAAAKDLLLKMNLQVALNE